MRHLERPEFVEATSSAGSIHGTAASLPLPSTALNRPLLAREAEFGESVFERLSRGARFSPAGEILPHHIRVQRADLERVRSQIAGLKGERRGHDRVACSHALLPSFMPRGSLPTAPSTRA